MHRITDRLFDGRFDRRLRGVSLTIAVLVAPLAFTITPCQAQVPTWSLRATSGPPARAGHAMVYDSTRGVIMLFGGATSGLTSGTVFNDTWEWNGTSWTLKSPATSPTARIGHAMAFDSARGVTVLYGGGDANGFLTDTWEWNGTNWTRRMPATPFVGSRASHAMAYDSTRGVTVLFGGSHIDNSLFLDTWEWNGTDWSQRATTGPCPRTSPAMFYDSAHNVSVLFGGYSIYGNGCDVQLGDTWTWNGATWTQKVVSGPGARHNHAMAFDSDRNVGILFGGYNDARIPYTVFGDTWAWSGTSWTREATTGPSARASLAMAYDRTRHAVVLFGGFDPNDGSAGPTSGETWEYALTGTCCDGGTCSITTESGCTGTWTPGASCATAPSSASASPNPACPGQTITLTAIGGSGGTHKWYANGCGVGGSIGTGPSTQLTAPATATTYYVRVEGSCGNSTCASVTVNPAQSPTAPSTMTITPSSACPGELLMLAASGGSGGVYTWYAAGCGNGSPIGTGQTINISAPNASTAYFLRMVGCTVSNCVTQTLSITQSATPPTSVSASPTSACPGQTVTLTAAGGSGGTYTWYADGCGSGMSIGTGASIAVQALAKSKTYFVRMEGACENPDCASITLVSPLVPPSSAIAEEMSFAPGTLRLTAMGGSSDSIRWYAGGCGSIGTYQGFGRVLVVNAPYKDMTFFARVEDACGNSDCVSVSYEPQKPTCPPSAAVNSGFCGTGTTCLLPFALGTWVLARRRLG